MLRAAGEPTFFHPGDAYDAEPGDVDSETFNDRIAAGKLGGDLSELKKEPAE